MIFGPGYTDTINFPSRFFNLYHCPGHGQFNDYQVCRWNNFQFSSFRNPEPKLFWNEMKRLGCDYSFKSDSVCVNYAYCQPISIFPSNSSSLYLQFIVLVIFALFLLLRDPLSLPREIRDKIIDSTEEKFKTPERQRKDKKIKETVTQKEMT